MESLRSELVNISLAWEDSFSVAPRITSSLSEYDAAALLGCTVEQISIIMKGTTAVQQGHDFIFNGSKYQVKACRPSGKRGSKVTKVPYPRNFEWDFFVYIQYNRMYEIEEAWLWSVEDFKNSFLSMDRLSPNDIRRGVRLDTL